LFEKADAQPFNLVEINAIASKQVSEHCSNIVLRLFHQDLLDFFGVIALRNSSAFIRVFISPPI
jgi:hypothetical protein